MKSFEIETHSHAQTEEVAAKLATLLVGGETIALRGDLGAGKTCFVRGLAVGLGCDERQVSSPTFILLQRYRGSRIDLVHVDAYRLSNPQQLRDSGLEIGAPDSVAAIEWAEKVEGELPGESIQVRLTATSPTDRQIVVEAMPDFVEGLRVSMRARPCAICGAAVPFLGEFKPFCSKRCREVDLGRWIDGRYTISRPIEQTDLDED
ncbi:MAG: tRNA (adenosine(37)-N6)-threonylcarbamoyltransferase complex ATPase subunit type 1 TsaE [Planctomycetes bacterium]|nr:tRNA (adenosine(37)-N6)-threonylcarbamoyltransferase complex ATPase subunit type 1 TsaE [Planctomycetota bacterium]